MVRYNNGQRFYILGKSVSSSTINVDYSKQVYNKPSLDTTSNKSLNPLKEDIDGEISLHKIAKTGNYKDLLYKPIIPITFTDNMKSDYSISELPSWQVSLLQQMINEYLKDNDSINNYILRADGIQYLEDSDSTFDTSMNYGKTESLFTFKKVGPYGSIPHAFQFIGSIIVNQKISKGSGYSSIYFRKNGIMIYCDKNYKITDVGQRYKLYGGDKDNDGFHAYYISTNDSYTTAYIPTKDYQPATKKYVDGQTNSIISNIGTLTDLTTTNKDNLVNAINEVNDIYYQSGEVTLGGLTWGTALLLRGHITSESKSVILQGQVPKSLMNINNITPKSLKFETRGIKGYINDQSGFIEYVGKSGYECIAHKINDYTIEIIITKSTAYTNISNNTPLTAYGEVKLELS